MTLRRFDTLWLRLFVLMWVTLVASHLLAISLALPLGRLLGAEVPQDLQMLQRAMTAQMAQMPQTAPGSHPHPGGLPPLASMPPGGLLQDKPGPHHGSDGPQGQGQAHAHGLPTQVLWADYGLRALVIALGAALGARWLAAPMGRLSRAAQALAAELARGKTPPPLREAGATQEVQAAASAFNAMACRLQEQFDARSMQMAALSHDLRTPLTRLRMRLCDAPPALAQAAGADIHEMSEMMETTLAVLREQRDGTAAGLLDLRSMLEALVDDRSAAGDNVQLADGPALRTHGHPAALRRVVDNLVSNALRYGGGAQLSLVAVAAGAAGAAGADGAGAAGGVEIHVDDQGPGIAAEQLEQAFKPWVRLDAQAQARAPEHLRAGHGLGLAIARDLAQRDGGRVSLANRPQGGLRATVWLPAPATRA